MEEQALETYKLQKTYFHAGLEFFQQVAELQKACNLARIEQRPDYWFDFLFTLMDMIGFYLGKEDVNKLEIKFKEIFSDIYPETKKLEMNEETKKQLNERKMATLPKLRDIHKQLFWAIAQNGLSAPLMKDPKLAAQYGYS